MTPDRPCRPELVLRYVFGPCSEEERSEFEAHVAICESCRSDLASIQQIVRAGSGREKPQAVSLDPIEKARKVAAAGADRAKTDIATLKNRSAEERRALIYQGSVAVTPALGWALIDEGYRLMRIAPRDAVVWLEMSCLVADSAAQFGAVELSVEAWNKYAWILSYFGEYAQAENALEWADLAADQCADRRHMRAIVQLSRGIFLSRMERWSEALPVVTASGQTFADLGDEDRRVKAVEQEANIRMRTGDAVAAAAALSGIVDLPCDQLTRAQRYSNIASALHLTGKLWAASEYLTKARAIHLELGALPNAHQNTWVLARILTSARRVDEALIYFESASHGFRSLGVADSAIRVDLDWSEAEIEFDVPTTATYDRLRVAATYAIEKQLPVAKCNALQYLQALDRAAKVHDVRHVRDFLAAFESNPHLQFRPPEMIS